MGGRQVPGDEREIAGERRGVRRGENDRSAQGQESADGEAQAREQGARHPAGVHGHMRRRIVGMIPATT